MSLEYVWCILSKYSKFLGFIPACVGCSSLLFYCSDVNNDDSSIVTKFFLEIDEGQYNWPSDVILHKEIEKKKKDIEMLEEIATIDHFIRIVHYGRLLDNTKIKRL